MVKDTTLLASKTIGLTDPRKLKTTKAEAVKYIQRFHLEPNTIETFYPNQDRSSISK